MVGVIKRMVRDKGFGFIREEGGTKEWFFHRSQCDPLSPYFNLKEEDRVEFTEAASDAKGPRAEGVRLV